MFWSNFELLRCVAVAIRSLDVGKAEGLRTWSLEKKMLDNKAVNKMGFTRTNY